MNGKDIFLGLKYVGEDLIEEAETSQLSVQANQKNTHRKIRRPLLIAALIALMLLLVGCAVVYVLKMQLSRTRTKLRARLEQEGITV